MARKSNGGYEPISLDNLEKAIKLWQELNSLHSTAIGYVENYDKYMAKIDSLVGQTKKGTHKQLAELQSELQYYKNIAIQEANIEKIKQQQLSIEQERIKINKEQEKISKQNARTMAQLKKYNKENSIPKSMQLDQLNWGNFGQFITTNSQRYKDAYKDAYDKSYKNALSREKRAAKKEGRAIDFNTVQTETTKGVAETLEKSGFTKKMQLVSGVFQTAANTFKSAVDSIWNVFMGGSKNQKQVYDDTFEGISVRTGITKNQYQSAQWNLNNQLSNYGVRDNVASSEVQSMWNTLVTNGVKLDLDSAEQTSKTIETVITSHIVPYLDTTSESFTILNQRLDNRFIRDIRGISAANLEIAGNNYTTQDMLQEIIDEVQPMSDKAMEDLAGASAEVSSFVNYLTGQGWSKDAAKSYATQLFKAKNYSNQVLQNGSLSEQLTMINAMNKGIDWTDPTQWNNYMAEAVNTTQLFAGQTPGYTSPTNSIITGAMADAIGETYPRMYGALQGLEKGITGTKAGVETDKAKDSLSKNADNATNSFTSGANQTKKTQQEIWLENASNELTTIREQLGIFEQPITTLLKGIGDLFALWLGSKILGGDVGKLATTLAGGGSLAGTALGTALGVTASVALPVAIAASVGKLSEYFDKKDIAKEGEKWALDHFGEPGADNSLYSDLQGEISHAEKNNKNGGALWSAFAYMWNSSFGRIGGGDHDTKNYLNLIQSESDINSKMGKSGVGESTQALKLAYYVAADRAGQLKTLGISQSELKESLQLSGYDDHNKLVNFLSTYIPILSSSGYMPKTSGGVQITTDQVLNDGWLKKNYYRQGLSEVPYDDYPAILHEGEAVLTASTANELRSLLDEYRSTSTQSVQFDVIIQNQTSALVEKMNEIISVIGNIPTTYRNTDSSRSKANTLLTNSMTKIISTRNYSQ